MIYKGFRIKKLIVSGWTRWFSPDLSSQFFAELKSLKKEISRQLEIEAFVLTLSK